MARYGVSDYSSFVSCKKSIVCLTLSEKRTSEAAWVVAIFTEFLRVVGWRNFRAAVSNGLADHIGLRYICKP